MSRKLLAFLLSKLSVVRVTYKHCNSTVEFTLGRIKTPFARGECPLCLTPVCKQNDNPIFLLANAIANMNLFDKLDVEFVLEDKSP